MIPEIKKVLFATDLSDNARHAFSYAAAEATRHGASMVLLHVIEEFSGSVNVELEGLFGTKKWQEMREQYEQKVRDMIIDKRDEYDVVRGALADFCEEAHAADPRCSFEAQEILVKKGQVVAEEILKTAVDEECDLIVLGAHKGLLGRTALGSVAKAVVHRARVPVLLVPPPEKA